MWLQGLVARTRTEAEFAVGDGADPFMILEPLTEAVVVDEITNCERKIENKEQGISL